MVVIRESCTRPHTTSYGWACITDIKILFKKQWKRFHFYLRILNPGRKSTAGNGRKALEIAGKWKQYSDRKIFGLFPIDSIWIPAPSCRNSPEKHRKIFRKFPAGILLPLPTNSRVFLQDMPFFPTPSRKFLQDPASGIIDLGTCTWLLSGEIATSHKQFINTVSTSRTEKREWSSAQISGQ